MVNTIHHRLNSDFKIKKKKPEMFTNHQIEDIPRFASKGEVITLSCCRKYALHNSKIIRDILIIGCAYFLVVISRVL